MPERMEPPCCEKCLQFRGTPYRGKKERKERKKESNTCISMQYHTAHTAHTAHRKHSVLFHSPLLFNVPAVSCFAARSRGTKSSPAIARLSNKCNESTPSLPSPPTPPPPGEGDRSPPLPWWEGVNDPTCPGSSPRDREPSPWSASNCGDKDKKRTRTR